MTVREHSMSGAARDRGVRLPAIAGWDHVARLFRYEKRLVLRLFVTAIGRAVASMMVVLLIQRFLSGALGGGARSGVVGRIASAVGPSGALIALGAILLVCQLAASLCNYGNMV